MTPASVATRGLLRLAGIAALLAGALVLCFAILADGHGLLFDAAVYEGASTETWRQAVVAAPRLSKVIMLLPALGFSCMLLLVHALRRCLQQDSWQLTLALVGYGIGVPVAVFAFTVQLALMNEVLLIHAYRPEASAALEATAGVLQLLFHLVNQFVGPFFVIVLGTSMMAWAVLRARLVPRWICLWLMTCGAMVCA
ncbi:MAG: DUF4386 family protein, partial [Planctomycetota bacterium]